MKPFTRVLMVDPEEFRVEYAINPYMRDAKGKLQIIDSMRARQQWEYLKSTYVKLGFTVEVLVAQKNLPDMVFAANQSFPFWKEGGDHPSVLLSEMRSEKRKPEVQFFANTFSGLGYDVEKLETSGSFEGNGDALYHPLREVIFGGYGPRSDLEIYAEVEQRTGFRVVPLKLVNENFYHLDTCFTILNRTTVGIVREAFTSDDIKKIEAEFAKVITIKQTEALQFFAGNAHSPDDQHVLLHPGAVHFEQDLKGCGFTPVPIETGEFIKSGGSVFCLKVMCW